MKILVQNNFAIGQSHLGVAVFAARVFCAGDVITQFTGPIFTKDQIPKKYEGAADRYVQIGRTEFMGPSGEIDDLINHSCDPNTGLRFTNSGILLVALRDIQVGEEITWDYSTTMLENDWKMKCDCKTEKCRSIIGDFSLLEKPLQEHYREIGVIPHYIQEYMNSPEYTVYTDGIEKLRAHAKSKKQ